MQLKHLMLEAENSMIVCLPFFRVTLLRLISIPVLLVVFCAMMEAQWPPNGVAVPDTIASGGRLRLYRIARGREFRAFVFCCHGPKPHFIVGGEGNYL